MSRLVADAPIRHRRHSDAVYHDFKQHHVHVHAVPNDGSTLNDSTLPPSSRLKPLLLPAQLEIRRVSERAKLQTLPKRYLTDSTFHIHQLVARQSASSTALDQALKGVTASSSCRSIVQQYEGSVPAGLLRRACGLAVAQAREDASSASPTSTSAASSTDLSSSSSTPSPTTSSTSSSTSTSNRAATTSRRRRAAQATATRMQTLTASASLPTGQVAAVTIPPGGPSSVASFVSSEFGAAASAVASRAAASSSSRAALQSSVDSLFSAAASEVSSRRAAATASSTLSPSSSLPPTPPSSSTSSLPPSSNSSSPSSTSSGASATSAGSRSNHDRLVKTVVPSVVVPIGVLLLLLLAFCFWRRRKRRAGAAGGLGPISNPQPLRASPRAYGAVGAGAAGSAAMAQAAAAGGNGSQESFGTTPSAIGVAFSEPRTRWGRRSLVDVLAGGVRSANTPDSSAAAAVKDRQRGHSRTSSFGGGRQPSMTSSPSVASELRGVGGYNSWTGYQPGQMRPVISPVPPQHYDPFGPPSITAVPASAQRHHYASSVSSQSGYISDAGPSRSPSSESFTARLAPPLAGGYAHAPAAQQSRTTQASEGADGYWTADPGFSSTDGGHDDAEELSEGGAFRQYSPEEEAVNFGSSSGSNSGSGEDPYATPRSASMDSTPRLGAGHGSGVGNRRNDGTGSWWN
ncbi:hypothetical protein JCM10213_008795 [Rhodosporidiobolus nylandii]